ncbi:MAG: antibiotic biosynthesis monooxygenase [Lentisphaerae bacterium]|nr:antibiotic biosynthesis monooxygenase [Lentisphaerota bacterium]
MIHVLASIRVKPGCRARFLEIFKSNVPAVRAEPGCGEYRPTVDIESGLKPQRLEPDTVVIIEKWESLDALRKHLAAPHMAAYREKSKDLVADVSLKVLQDA